MPIVPSHAVRSCEAVLREDMEYNLAHKIWPSVNRVIERMLSRSVELHDAYAEIHKALDHHPRALKGFFDVFLYTPVAWSPEKIREARIARKELIDVNEQISLVASQLAGLLTRRDELKEYSSFSCDTHYHVLDVMAEASEHNYLFESHVKEHLDEVQYQYDLKYWPSLSAFVEVIGINADGTEVVANDPATAAATEGRRSGLADFLKAFAARVSDNTVKHQGFIPNDFKLSDNALASLVNCSLNLDVDDLIDASFIKRFRQRQRQSSKV